MTLAGAIVLQSPISIAVYDLDGRLVFGNAAYERHFGVRVADVPASYSLLTDPQLEAAGLLPGIRRAYAGETVVLPPVRYDAAQASEGEGRVVWTEAHCFPVCYRASLNAPAGADLNAPQGADLDAPQGADLDARQGADADAPRGADVNAPPGAGASCVVTHLAIAHLDVTSWATTDASLRALTAEAEAARAVAEQERSRLNEILSQLPAALAVFEGPDLRVRAMSAAYRQIIGGRDALDKPIREAVPELEGQGYFEEMESVYFTGRAAHGSDAVASWDVDGDGEPEERIVDYTFSPLVDPAGTTEGIVVLVSDMSERARSQRAERVAKAAAEESAARLSAVLEALPDAAAVYDADWRYIYLNPAARALHAAIFRITGTEPPGGTALGHVAWTLFPWLAGTRFDIESRRAVAERRVVEYVEYVEPLQQWLETRIIPIATGVVSLNRDVTAQRALELQREELREAERVAAERVRRLQHLTARLNQATTTPQIASAIFEGGLAAVGAHAGSLGVVHRDAAGAPTEIQLVRTEGYASAIAERYERFPVHAGRPVSEAVLHGEPVFIESLAEWRSAWPDSDPGDTGYEAFVAMPVRAGDRVVAVLSFSFRTACRFDDATRTYLTTLGEQCALALERQRLHETELRVTERHAALLETIQDAFIALDVDLRITYMNRRAEQLLRRDAAAVLGRTIHESFPEGQGTPIREAIHRALERGESLQTEEYSAVTQSWLEVRISPAPDGVSVLLQDITERRRAQQTAAFMAEASRLLSASLDYETTLRAVADAAVPHLADWCAVDIVVDEERAGEATEVQRLAVVHHDPERLALWQEMTRRYPVDWSSTTVTGRVLREAVPHFVPEVTDEVRKTVALDEEHLRILRDLDWRSVIIVPMIAHGRVLGCVTLCASAGRRRYDAADLAVALDLAQRAAIAVDNARHFRNAERARHEAEEANRVKSQFLATMSHELRTPLNAIAGHVQLIELGLHGPVTDPQRDALARVDRAQRHLLGLINDVLRFARIEGGYVEYDLRPTDMADVVHGVVPMVEPQLLAQGLAFEVRVHEPRASVLADAEKLGQVLLNLLSNAIKFTPSGGRVTIEVGGDAGTPGVASVRVIDTGVGIPADKLESIFDPFMQVRRGPYAPSSGGTGLGLAISRDLARGMHGDVTAESVEGQGSTFTVSLPIAEPA